MVNKNCNCFLKKNQPNNNNKNQSKITSPQFFLCLGGLSSRDSTSNSPLNMEVVVKNQKNGVFSLKLYDLSDVWIEV